MGQWSRLVSLIVAINTALSAHFLSNMTATITTATNTLHHHRHYSCQPALDHYPYHFQRHGHSKLSLLLPQPLPLTTRPSMLLLRVTSKTYYRFLPTLLSKACAAACRRFHRIALCNAAVLVDSDGGRRCFDGDGNS